MAGLILLLMGLFRLGTVIKFIPYPIVVGFTAGIAITIFSTQINDFFGLGLKDLPGDFISKWGVLLQNFSRINWLTFAVGVVSLLIITLTPKISKKLPGALIAIILVTAGCLMLGMFVPDFHVETIGDRFGDMKAEFPVPHGFAVDMATINALLPSAFTIAMLGAIESLLLSLIHK